MGFKLIEGAKWNRKEYFDHYLNQVPCTYNITVNLDLTNLLKEIQKKGVKLYPTLIYLLSVIVNRHEEFRTTIDNNGQLGIFDFLHPCYTIFQKSTEAFTNIWTDYSSSFSEFYEQYLLDVKNFGEVKSFIAKPNMPENVFNISSLPWISFTGFNLNLPKATEYLLPIFTTGKYFEHNDKILLPISIQVHHAVCDGFHIARFINELQDAMNTLKLCS